MMQPQTSKGVAAALAFILSSQSFAQQNNANALPPPPTPPAPVLPLSERDQLLQSIVNPNRPFTPNSPDEATRALYSWRWSKEIGQNTEDYLRLGGVIQRYRFGDKGQMMAGPDLRRIDDRLDALERMASTGKIESLENLRDENESVLFWVNSVAAAISLAQPELAVPVGVPVLGLNAINEIINSTTEPDQKLVKRAANEGIAVLRQYGRQRKDFVNEFYNLGNDPAQKVFGDKHVDELNQLVEQAFPKQGKVLPKIGQSGAELIAGDFETAVKEAQKVTPGQPLPEKVRSDLLAASIRASEAIVNEKFKGSVEGLKAKLEKLDSLVDDKIKALEKAATIREINNVAMEASASVNAIATIVNQIDPEAARAVNIIGSAGIQVGVSVAMLSTGIVTPTSVGGIVTGVFSLGGLFGGDPGAERHRQVMEALGRIQEQVYNVHVEVVEARKDIGWLHSDMNRNFWEVHNALSRIELELTQGLRAERELLKRILSKEVTISGIVDELAKDVDFLQNFQFDTAEKEKIHAGRDAIERARVRSIRVDPSKIDEDLFTIYRYATSTSSSFNVNGGYYPASLTESDAKVKWLTERDPERLIAMFSRLLGGGGVYRSIPQLTSRVPMSLEEARSDALPPNPREFVDAANTFLDVFLANYKEIRGAQVPGRAPSYEKQLQQLSNTCSTLIDYLMLVDDPRNLEDSRLAYIMAFDGYISVLLDQISSELPPGSVTLGAVDNSVKIDYLSAQQASLLEKQEKAPLRYIATKDEGRDQGAYSIEVTVPSLPAEVLYAASSWGRLEHDISFQHTFLAEKPRDEFDFFNGHPQHNWRIQDTCWLAYVGNDGKKARLKVYERTLSMKEVSKRLKGTNSWARFPWNFPGVTNTEWQMQWERKYGYFTSARAAMHDRSIKESQESLKKSEQSARQARLDHNGEKEKRFLALCESTRVEIADEEKRKADTIAAISSLPSLRDIFEENARVRFEPVANIVKEKNLAHAREVERSKFAGAFEPTNDSQAALEKAAKDLNLSEFTLDLILRWSFPAHENLQNSTLRATALKDLIKLRAAAKGTSGQEIYATLAADRKETVKRLSDIGTPKPERRYVADLQNLKTRLEATLKAVRADIALDGDIKELRRP